MDGKCRTACSRSLELLGAGYSTLIHLFLSWKLLYYHREMVSLVLGSDYKPLRNPRCLSGGFECSFLVEVRLDLLPQGSDLTSRTQKTYRYLRQDCALICSLQLRPILTTTLPQGHNPELCTIAESLKGVQRAWGGYQI